MKLGYFSIICGDAKAYKPIGPRIKVFGKIIITARDRAELRNTLRSANYSELFITVHPVTVETARWAAHDGRVDSILMSLENMKIFDKKQASTMKYYAKPLEVHLPSLLHKDYEVRSMIYRRLNLFARYRVPLIIGSAAGDWCELVSPISIIKLLSTLYDIPEKMTLLYLTEIPRLLIYSKWGAL